MAQSYHSLIFGLDILPERSFFRCQWTSIKRPNSFRSPDSKAFWLCRPRSFTKCRLSTIDLSEAKVFAFCSFKIDAAVLEYPVKNNKRLPSRLYRVSSEIFKGQASTRPSGINLKQVIPP